VGGYRVPLDLVNRYNLQNFVHVASDLTDEQLKYLYLRAEVNLFPSRHEGFGLSVLEGMACGCPAVVHFGHATQEVLQQGGLAVDTSKPEIMAEAVVSIIEAREFFSQAALERSRDFDWGLSTSKIVRTIYWNED
jgi:glycosyltransferase involved in cell wall biosynthesis